MLGDQRYSSTLSLTSALDKVRGQLHLQATVPSGRNPVPIEQEAGWVVGPVWTNFEKRKFIAPVGVRTPDRSAPWLVAIPTYYFLNTVMDLQSVIQKLFGLRVEGCLVLILQSTFFLLRMRTALCCSDIE